VISRTCVEIARNNKIQELISNPTYQLEKAYEKNTDTAVIVTFDLAPSFELAPFDFEIERIIPKVSDEEVEEEKKRIISTLLIHEKAEKDHQIQPGDEVLYKAICYNNGVESKKKSFEDKAIVPVPEKIPEGSEFIAEFIGKKEREDFEFSLPVKTNIKYKFIIKKIKKAIRDISDEEFAKRKGFENVDALNKSIKKILATAIETKSFLYHKNQILDALMNQYNFELSPKVVANDIKNVMFSIRNEFPEEYKDKSDEDMKEECAEIANKRVTLGYVLNKIAKESKISVSDKKVQNLIMFEINNNPSAANSIIEYYSNNPDAFAYKRAAILEEKVIAFLMTQVKTKDVEKTKAEVDQIIKEFI
jgi:trigger factor